MKGHTLRYSNSELTCLNLEDLVSAADQYRLSAESRAVTRCKAP